MARQIFQINLDPNCTETRDYQAKGTNLMRLCVSLPNEKIANVQNTARFTISVDGMLGMGMELIRRAMEFKTDQRASLNDELMPIGPDGELFLGEIGVLLTHDSSRLVWWDDNSLGTYLEQIKLSKEKISITPIEKNWQSKLIKQSFFTEQTQVENRIFEFDLNSGDNEIQLYEKNKANLMQVSAKLPTGEIISGFDACVVCAGISIDGMLGLGTELIRKALRMKALGQKESSEIERLEPIGPNGGSSGSLGVYLTHDSCSLEFMVKDLGTYPEQVKLAEQAWKAQGGT